MAESLVNQEICGVENFFVKSVQPDALKTMVKTIRRNILNLDAFCKVLAHSIGHHDWRRFDRKTSLKIVKMLADVFLAHPATVKVGIEGIVHSLPTLQTASSQEAVISSLSRMIAKILAVSPLSRMYLLEVLTDSVPHPFRPKTFILNYFKFLFALIEKAPNLRPELVGLAIRGIMALDMQLSGENRQRNGDILKYIKDNRVEMGSISAQFPDLDSQTVHWLETGDKLDDILFFSLENLKKIQENDPAFYDILSYSLDKLLSCRGLIVTPFVWFYFCSESKEFLEKFLASLWGKFIDINTVIYIKHACLIFIGGVLSRGLFVNTELFEKYSRVISEWIHEYIRSDQGLKPVELKKNTSSFQTHHLFYVACQALFYCLIFRTKFVEDRESSRVREWREKLAEFDLERVFYSRFNPLFFCCGKVARKIAEIGTKYELYFVHQVVDRNSRLLKMSDHKKNKKNNDTYVNILDLESQCNFPYDPHVMPSTNHLIQPNYFYFSSN